MADVERSMAPWIEAVAVLPVELARSEGVAARILCCVHASIIEILFSFPDGRIAPTQSSLVTNVFSFAAARKGFVAIETRSIRLDDDGSREIDLP